MRKKVKKNSIVDYIKILICIVLCIFVVYGLWLNELRNNRIDARNEQLAIVAMHKECELNCASYGVFENDLSGPIPTASTLLQGRHSFPPEYFWINQSQNLVLDITIVRNSISGKELTKNEWFSPSSDWLRDNLKSQ